MSGRCSGRFLLIMTAAFVFAQYCGTSGADELGRLFTTPEERSLLEKLRKPPPAGTTQTRRSDDPAKVERDPGNTDIAVKGFVYHKQGRNTVWIDSAPVLAHGTHDRRLRIISDVRNAGEVLFDIPDGRTAIRVRPEKMSHSQITE